MREEGRTRLLYKNIYVFLFFRKELKLLWFGRQTDAGRQDRLLYWLIISSLDYSTLCYLQDLLNTSPSRPGLLNPRPGMGHRRQQARSQRLQAGFDSGLHCLQLSQLEATQLDAAVLSRALTLSATGSHPDLHCLQLSTAAGICIYYFITPIFLPIKLLDLLPLIYIDASLIDGSVKGQ